VAGERKAKMCWFSSGKWFWMSIIAAFAVAGERKAKMCWFSSGKWFWLSIIAEFAVAGETRSTVVHLQKRM
jgi:hypothetical protein